MTPVALTIAGSDPSGGAGLQADLKTFQAHRVYGEAVVSLLTVQSTRGVTRVEPVSAALIGEQLAALWADIAPNAAKTGALPSVEAIEVIADAFATRACPLVVDPISSASSGHAFAARDLARAFVDKLGPVAALLTPNAVEAEQLTGVRVDDAESAARAAAALIARGCRAVLVKGGHFSGEPVDVLLCADGTQARLSAARVHTPHTHGTGCTYSAAITAQLARGRDLVTAVKLAKAWLARVIECPLGLGAARGPLNHFVPVSDLD
jgi:hydroxymethylpyrimidine/phosphomethylpyrimidine kinase